MYEIPQCIIFLLIDNLFQVFSRSKLCFLRKNDVSLIYWRRNSISWWCLVMTRARKHIYAKMFWERFLKGKLRHIYTHAYTYTYKYIAVISISVRRTPDTRRMSALPFSATRLDAMRHYQTEIEALGFRALVFFLFCFRPFILLLNMYIYFYILFMSLNGFHYCILIKSHIFYKWYLRIKKLLDWLIFLKNI